MTQSNVIQEAIERGVKTERNLSWRADDWKCWIPIFDKDGDWHLKELKPGDPRRPVFPDNPRRLKNLVDEIKTHAPKDDTQVGE